MRRQWVTPVQQWETPGWVREALQALGDAVDLVRQAQTPEECVRACRGARRVLRRHGMALAWCLLVAAVVLSREDVRSQP